MKKPVLRKGGKSTVREEDSRGRGGKYGYARKLGKRCRTMNGKRAEVHEDLIIKCKQSTASFQPSYWAGRIEKDEKG